MKYVNYDGTGVTGQYYPTNPPKVVVVLSEMSNVLDEATHVTSSNFLTDQTTTRSVSGFRSSMLLHFLPIIDWSLPILSRKRSGKDVCISKFFLRLLRGEKWCHSFALH